MKTEIQQVYDANKTCLILLPQITDLFRQQNFFEGSKRLVSLIENLGWVEKMLSDDQEFLLVLEAIMQAQECKDYVLTADLLEGDLLPILQNLQLQLTNENACPEELAYWEENLKALEAEPELRQILEDSCETDMEYEVLTAVNGQRTMKCRKDQKEWYMHSSVNPEREAEIFVRQYEQEGNHLFYVFGMGMGYHVKQVLAASKLNQVIVLEPSPAVLRAALTYLDFHEELFAGRLRIVYSKDLKELLGELRLASTDKILLIHYPSLLCLDQGEERTLLENYFMETSAMLEQKKNLLDNFERLQKMNLPECEVLKPLFFQKDTVIAAGGPSLELELDSMKQHRERFTLFAVGTTAKKLLGRGIVPDAVVITDSQESMSGQIADLGRSDIPLILLATASADVAEVYPGCVYLAYQKGFEPAEMQADQKGYMTFQTGGSVTTLALDVALRLQAKRIILVGTDFAYTNHQSHADGLGRTVIQGLELRQVTAVDGSLTETACNLDIYRRWVEKRIEKEDSVPVYNTAKGAKIAGTIEMSLQDIMTR